jgi:hypothetical protein
MLIIPVGFRPSRSSCSSVLYLSVGTLALLSPLVLLATFIRLITPVLMSLYYQTNKRLVAALGSTILLGCTWDSVCIGAARLCAPFPVARSYTILLTPFLYHPPLPTPVYTRCVSFHARAHIACKIGVAVR